MKGFSYCPHRDRSRFVEGSLLKEYLDNQCKGWVRDPLEEYTLNYILITLFADFKEKGLYYRAFDPDIVRFTAELQEIFKIKQMYVQNLRSQVGNHLVRKEIFNILDPTIKPSHNVLLLCPFGFENVIEKILYGRSLPICYYVKYYCKQF